MTIEPGSRVFRIRDSSGNFHQVSSFYLREALSGDGICFPEDLAAMPTVPEVIELHPWDEGGSVRDLELAVSYLGLLRQRFVSLFRRIDWKIVLSQELLVSQKQVWSTLLREASIRRFQLIANLDCLSRGRVEDLPGMFFHFGAGGGDLGLCLQGETYSYRRLLVGEDALVLGLRRWLSGRLGDTVSVAESFRVLKVVIGEGLGFPGGRLIEIGCGEGATSGRVSLGQEVLLQTILDLARPQLEFVETFVKGLSPREQGDLFTHGLSLSGGAASLPLLRDCLSEVFEFPVVLHPSPAEAVLQGA